MVLGCVTRLASISSLNKTSLNIKICEKFYKKASRYFRRKFRVRKQQIKAFHFAKHKNSGSVYLFQKLKKTISHVEILNSSWCNYFFLKLSYELHCVKSVQIRSFFWSVFSCIQTEYGEIQKHRILDTFHIVVIVKKMLHVLIEHNQSNFVKNLRWSGLAWSLFGS